MNDQTPIKYRIKSEDRSDITYASESDLEKAVHRLVILLDRGMDRQEERRGSRPVVAPVGKIRNFIEAYPGMTSKAIAAELGCSSTLVRIVRAEMGAGTHPIKSKYTHRLAALLAEQPKISNKEAAHILGCQPGSLTAMRRRVKLLNRLLAGETGEGDKDS